ncbi:PHP domain-containing protein [Vandammella animalimorsus]|uniref:Phosphatase n=1 Tax=Vandammella animalimorsus TaxID=2029117 RepID=A0A2A2AHR6_9BURK|nr:PHP domain-containing protein [Vandammella animalimorsus]PAT37293.1 phosphatase [Vandammella animalimorsus]
MPTPTQTDRQTERPADRPAHRPDPRPGAPEQGDAAALAADLHCHSTASDGTLAPAELAARAQRQGVALWALTDHDTLAGQRQAAQAARALGLAWVSGVEVSALYQGRTLHIVGLGMDIDHAALQQALAANQQLRVQRAWRMAQCLEQAGFRGVWQGALAQAGGQPSQLARPHLARYLVHSGQAGSEQQVFQRYLGEQGRCFVPTQWLPLQQAIAAIRAAGGLAVLAHPLAYDLPPPALQTLLQHFKASGGQAIEVISGPQPAAQIAELAAMARSHGLLASRGSDFHRPPATDGGVELGRLPPLPPDLQPVWAQPPLAQACEA